MSSALLLLLLPFCLWLSGRSALLFAMIGALCDSCVGRLFLFIVDVLVTGPYQPNLLLRNALEGGRLRINIVDKALFVRRASLRTALRPSGLDRSDHPVLTNVLRRASIPCVLLKVEDHVRVGHQRSVTHAMVRARKGLPCLLRGSHLVLRGHREFVELQRLLAVAEAPTATRLSGHAPRCLLVLCDASRVDLSFVLKREVALLWFLGATTMRLDWVPWSLLLGHLAVAKTPVANLVGLAPRGFLALGDAAVVWLALVVEWKGAISWRRSPTVSADDRFGGRGGLVLAVAPLAIRLWGG
mmetsp:Transcript_88367/g.193693  ORF Transcript_88367/g.193693 Transcript_88367/m.193693 type:complete len:299 (-) Transcript_88367:110-1006(-)